MRLTTNAMPRMRMSVLMAPSPWLSRYAPGPGPFLMHVHQPGSVFETGAASGAPERPCRASGYHDAMTRGTAIVLVLSVGMAIAILGAYCSMRPAAVGE